MEGTLESEVHAPPTNIIGVEKPPYFEYNRDIGTCIIGGSIYRESFYPDLNGKYLFADYTTGKIMALSSTSPNVEPDVEFLIANLNGQPVEIPYKPGITGVHTLPNGEILVTVLSENAFGPGKIFKLEKKADVPEPPSKLSDLGVFTNLETLETIEGIIPYSVNAPLWSDRALKKRWIAIPNDGVFDSTEEQIEFQTNQNWTFPKGTVFIKHFELPLTVEGNGETARLETRFFILTEDGNGYGLTYQWNEDGTEAFLLGGGTTRDFDIYDNGSIAFTQTWDYPSRVQCLSCHTDNSGYVLGVKTHQLNGDLVYPDLNQSMNQLKYLNELNVFTQNISNPNNYPKSYAIDDEEVSLELRIRSYLDSNCSSCHQLGGIPMVNMDLRYNTPLSLQNIINFSTQSQGSNFNQKIVLPGNHQVSEIWIRDASLEENRMPPIARNLVDEVYVDVLAEWIDGLPEDAGTFDDMLVFPNPGNGWLNLRVSDNWIPPFIIAVYSARGELIHSEEREAKSLQLDLTYLPTGIYSLEVMDANNREVKKFVVN